MLPDWLPVTIQFEAASIAGTALWALALYLGFSSLGDWTIDKIHRGLNWAERSFYASQEAFERAHQRRESQIAFLASLLSIIPFLILGSLSNYGVEVGLGRSWAVSMGLIACISCGVYELGRRDGQAPD